MAYLQFRERSTTFDGVSSPALLSDSDGGRLHARHHMPAGQIMQELTKRGCSDLTPDVDPDACRGPPHAVGGYCDIHKVRLRDGTKVAIKALRLRGEMDGIDDKRQRIKLAARELHCWYKLQHRNVVPLLGFVYARGSIAMVSKWLNHGHLLWYLQRNPEADRIKICKEIAAGLSYIHGCDIVHGDLKAVNVMISQSGRAMITDFGSVKLSPFRLGPTKAAQERGMTLRWMAPELVGEDNPEVTRATDIYAYGLTAFEALTEKVPYADKDDQRVLNMILAHKPPYSSVLTNFATRKLSSIAEKCWDPEPERRPSMATILKSLRDLVRQTARPNENSQDSGERVHPSRSSTADASETKQNLHPAERQGSDPLDSIYVGFSGMSLNSSPVRRPLGSLNVNTQTRDRRPPERIPPSEAIGRRSVESHARDSAQSSYRRVHVQDAGQRERVINWDPPTSRDRNRKSPSSPNSRSSVPAQPENTRNQADETAGTDNEENENRVTGIGGHDDPPRTNDERGFPRPRYQRPEYWQHGDQRYGYQQYGRQQYEYQQYAYEQYVYEQYAYEVWLLQQAAYLGRAYRVR